MSDVVKSVSGEELSSLLSAGGRVIVDVWAPWCAPCKVMLPRLEAAAKLAPDVRFVKLNAEEEQDTVVSLAVSALPTLIVFEAGVEVARKVGASNQKEIECLANQSS